MSPTFTKSNARNVFLLVAILTSAWSTGGCKLLRNRSDSAPTQTDRLMRTYPELASGRFAVIADFENPAHMELFQLIGVSEDARCKLSPKHGRKATGKNGLMFRAASPDDTIVVNNRHATAWYLKRNWTDYDLLMLTVNSPENNLALQLLLVSGTGERVQSAFSSIRLERGWNILRLDLADIGEHVALDDIQELQLSIEGLERATTLSIDDIILTSSRKTLLGNPQVGDGRLFAQRVGRRLTIGSAGRFEITFANGQIVRWHNLETDPHRLVNLVEGTTLGPTPVWLDVPDDRDAQSMFGRYVSIRPHIVELNPIRAVLTCEQRFMDDPNRPSDDRPFRRWTYTIYPSGQIYASVTSTTATRQHATHRVGLDVNCSSDRDDVIRTQSLATAETGETATPAHGYFYSPARQAGLLYVVAGAHRASQIIERFDPVARLSTLEAICDVNEEPVTHWSTLLHLHNGPMMSQEAASIISRNFAHPPQLKVEIGSVADTFDGRPLVNGFDRHSGTYVLTAERGRLRFSLDGRDSAIVAPAFRIIGTATPQVWIYVNHLIHDRVFRAEDGTVLFQLPGTIDSRTLIEVIFRQSGGFNDA